MSSKSIVVGYDGTDGGHTALDEALRVAGEIGGDIVIVYAYDKIISGGELHDLDAVIKERGAAILTEAEAAAAAAGVPSRTEFVEGRPADVLVATADACDARFIVIGSYGERPLKGAIVGSTPNKLIHLSERPIIVVRVPE
jgi:nucleotide-binding universal stress UspA family protein